jgi:putative flavoprotein involved in K+ transport
VVLEQADRPAEAWRNHRWDSFMLNTPRWQSRLPGVADGRQDPDGFMSRDEIVARLEELALPLPVRYRARVGEVEHNSLGYYVLQLDSGERIRARNVVVATGLHQTPKIPAISGRFPADIKQLHSDTYRNPGELLPGAVLGVGSAQSGAQIAEELNESGRKVYLAVSRAGRTPRRYRGKDANWWSDRLGLYDRKVGDLPSPKAKFAGKPHISGTRGGHTINLHQFARQGITLLGRLEGVEQGVITLAPDLHANLAAADRFEADFTRAIDAYVEAKGMAAPTETLPVFTDGFAQPTQCALGLRMAGITNVIWATGYAFDFSMIRLPILDADGYPIQTRGVTAYPGLFFVGLPWLHSALESSLIQRRLGKVQRVVCASPIYLARRGTPRAPRDLNGHNCLNVSNASRTHRWRFASKAGELEVDVMGNLCSNSIEAVRAAALNGRGVCLLPLLSVAEDRKTGRLLRLLPDYVPFQTAIQAVYPGGRHLSTRVRTFLDFVAKRLREVDIYRPKGLTMDRDHNAESLSGG